MAGRLWPNGLKRRWMVNREGGPAKDLRRRWRSCLVEESPRWAVRRAHWRAMGLTEEDLERPKIAIVNSSSELAMCFRHLDGIAARLKEIIRSAGGVPFEIRTAAPADFITSAGHGGGYVLSARDLIVNDIEVAVEGALLDGMICLSSCDKTVPAHLMAAARLDLPTLIVACGYQPSGEHRGKVVDIEDVFLHASGAAVGACDLREVWEMADRAIQGPGVCPGMGTANSMHMACEALGMALPGSTPVRANSPRMWDVVEEAGRRIVELVREDVKPRQILKPEAFANAVMVMLAVGASINVVKHLQAVAKEARCPVDIYELFAQYEEKVPLLVAVRPNGEHRIEDLEEAGGTLAVLKRLEPLLAAGVPTVAGRTLQEILRDVRVLRDEVVRPLDRPWRKRGTIVILKGSLAPQGAIVRLGSAQDGSIRFSGPAKVYGSQEQALEGLRRGEVRPGQVVVIRGMGPRGRPGMGMVSAFAFALDRAGLSGRVAMVSDGQVSGLLNRGLVVAEVCPEAAEGGPLAWVEDGDRIVIDLEARRVDLEVPPEVLEARRQARSWESPVEEHGWLEMYRKLVRPLRDGAILVESIY